MSGEIVSEKVNLIEINIKKISQLFNSLDPSPFLDKDLDDDAFEYIVSSVYEHSSKRKHKILIHLPKNQRTKISELEIKRAVHNFFEYKTDLANKKIQRNFKEAEFSLVVGFVFLFACLGFRDYLLTFHNSPILEILTEGLLVGSWVAMWKPISNILYDWWPLYQDRNIYMNIANMDIEFRYT